MTRDFDADSAITAIAVSTTSSPVNCRRARPRSSSTGSGRAANAAEMRLLADAGYLFQASASMPCATNGEGRPLDIGFAT